MAAAGSTVHVAKYYVFVSRLDPCFPREGPASWPGALGHVVRISLSAQPRDDCLFAKERCRHRCLAAIEQMGEFGTGPFDVLGSGSYGVAIKVVQAGLAV